MKKSEIFDIIVNKVCEVCEVRKDAILNNLKMQAVVDARMLAVQYLIREGISADDIALIMFREQAGDMTFCPDKQLLRTRARGFNKQFNVYSRRCMESRAFRIMSADIAKFCREQFGKEEEERIEN